jgi:hypothetical protein
MREFRRPKVKCNSCNFFTHFSTGVFEAAELDPQTDIVAHWPDPPSVTESCPKCGNAIDTSAVYPYLQGFAPGFEELKGFYKDFGARWETHRESFEVALSDWASQVLFEEVVKELNAPGGQQWYRQRVVLSKLRRVLPRTATLPRQRTDGSEQLSDLVKRNRLLFTVLLPASIPESVWCDLFRIATIVERISAGNHVLRWAKSVGYFADSAGFRWRLA